ncbi:MAG: response regulator transcription factor [Candidatus Omnitrophota bacterium]
MPKKILLVEDYDEFREMVKVHLVKHNSQWEIFEASSGELGVIKALREHPDVVLMDIRLPNINGIDAANQIKKYLPQVKIIILTMFETDAFKEMFKSEDITAYIGKSEIYEKLIPEIEKHLAEA